MASFEGADLRKLIGLIDSATRVSVAVHAHPDGDALGSAIGLMTFLKARRGDLQVRILLPDPVAPSLAFVTHEYRKDILSRDTQEAAIREWIAGSDLVFCLDCNGFSRTEGLREALEASAAPKVLIDHHIGPERDSFDLVFSETEISSASELLYQILCAIDPGKDLPLETATALMTGMTTDTNNFANSVYPSTLAMASDLLRLGVDRDAIVDKVFNSYRFNRIKALGHLLDNKLTYVDGGGAYMILSLQEQDRFGLLDGDTEGFVNIPLSVEQIRLSVFLKETSEGHFRVSVRSRKGTSARALASQFFHGGGHENASGGKLWFPGDVPTPADAADYVEYAITKLLAQ